MSKSTTEDENQIPLMNSLYSGVPDRLISDARDVKNRLYSIKTLPPSVSRTRVALPPDVSQDQYNQAIAELEETIGKVNVQINNQPLQDGWYMQHP